MGGGIFQIFLQLFFKKITSNQQLHIFFDFNEKKLQH